MTSWLTVVCANRCASDQWRSWSDRCMGRNLIPWRSLLRRLRSQMTSPAQGGSGHIQYVLSHFFTIWVSGDFYLPHHVHGTEWYQSSHLTYKERKCQTLPLRALLLFAEIAFASLPWECATAVSILGSIVQNRSPFHLQSVSNGKIPQFISCVRDPRKEFISLCL